MKIIKQGYLPEDRLMVGECDKCGCVFECAKHETFLDRIECPTHGCNEKVDVRYKDDED